MSLKTILEVRTNMYSNFLSINKNFQSSVNLELDLGKESKIKEYIPTTDICDVLKRYVNVALGNSKDKATTLIGPYGKGKSFLLLVLSYIFGKEKNTQIWLDLLQKIKEVDTNLFDMLIKVKEKNITLLPVIINSNYDNITQSFQIALNEALKREGMNDIVPVSAYEICIDLLNKWTSKDSVREEVLQKCLEVNSLNISKLRKGLESYSPIAYKQFEALYNCVNIGLEFNPLVNNDIVKIYSDVANSIGKYGYSGLFIIFDEFSKFLESASSNIMKDLKIVQDMAELAARSGLKNQIHFCCVAHKSLSLYKSDKKANISVDSFKTVEGRFKEIKFNRSLEENYQIISSAIIKSKEAEKEIENRLAKCKEFYDRVLKLSLFNDDFAKKTLFYGCFPLNPLTAYSLIQISEYAAQNERTLFTFISDTDDDSFNSFIHSKDDGLFNVDKIYDYFSGILQKEESNSIRNIWYRSESILSKLENYNERKVVKALSIVLMINDSDVFPSSEEVISLATEIELNETIKIVNSLIERHYFRKNILNNLLSFALSNTKQIDEAVELNKKTKFKNIKYGDVANIINEKKFILPRKHNEENKITRFFKVIFLSEDEFNAIKSFNYYFENNYCDGLVVYLLRDHMSEKAITDKVIELNDLRLIVKYPKEYVSPVFYQYLLTYACLNEVKKQKRLDDIAQSEIELLMLETESDINSLISKYYEYEANFFSVFKEPKESFNSLISKTMDNIFKVKLIFNNELINKKDVTTQYQKAINHVIDWLIDGEGEFAFSATSPETSVKVAILDNNDILLETESSKNFRKIIESIKDSITENGGKKISITNMLEFLTKEPYGIRKGVLPVILAKAISELSDNIILYFQSKEIELDASNIVKAVSNDKYQLSFSRGSVEQRNYLKKMLSLFGLESLSNFRKDTVLLANGIKRFFVGLPQIIRLCNTSNNYINLEENFVKYKTLFLSFNMNPYEAVFDAPKKILNTKKYSEIFDTIKYYKDNADSLILPFKSELINKIKNIFEIDLNSSLKSGFSDFLSKYIKEGTKPILETKQKSIYNLITIAFSYDDFEALGKLSKICVGQYLEDWDSDKEEYLLSELVSFKESIIAAEKVTSGKNEIASLLEENKELSGMASLLKNNVESVLDEFSGSVSSTEKIAVLSALLKDLL